ncbi:hypothetical protein B5X24_HaOG217119 [Helicoverpa armigera]|uniref:Uncharacterized protein n=1 Tax=Helicoverpa armigera TaxID=29058 RepID=A0A2W1C3Q5_HELAM|nr:hypothetical protein B5X24_HaOG217119 [Helicoverpa armigera]
MFGENRFSPLTVVRVRMGKKDRMSANIGLLGSQRDNSVSDSGCVGCRPASAPCRGSACGNRSHHRANNNTQINEPTVPAHPSGSCGNHAINNIIRKSPSKSKQTVLECDV